MDKDEMEEMERELNKILDECEDIDENAVDGNEDPIIETFLNRDKVIMNLSWYIQDNFKRRK